MRCIFIFFLFENPKFPIYELGQGGVGKYPHTHFPNPSACIIYEWDVLNKAKHTDRRRVVRVDATGWPDLPEGAQFPPAMLSVMEVVQTASSPAQGCGGWSIRPPVSSTSMKAVLFMALFVSWTPAMTASAGSPSAGFVEENTGLPTGVFLFCLLIPVGFPFLW